MSEQEHPEQHGQGYEADQHAASPSGPVPGAEPAGEWSRTETQPGLGFPASADPGTADTTPTGFPGYQPSGWTAPAPQQAGGHPAPGFEAPGYQGYQAPSYQAPGYQAPGYQAPGYQAPGYQAPGYQAHAPYQPSSYQAASASGAWEQPGQTATAQPARRNGKLTIGVVGLVAGALIGGGAGAGIVALTDHPSTSAAASSGPAQNVVIKDPSNATSVTAAAGKAAPSVVTIYVTNGQGAGSGSGVVLSSDGYVLTNNHVVTLEGSGTGNVQVRTPDGSLHDASVVGTDATFDLAVIKLQGASGLKPATFADSDKVQVGDLAVAIGAPLGLSNTVTDGIISATNRAVETGSTQNDATVIDALQTDAAINPGNSGGALVNGSGEVMGINTAIASVASDSSSQSQSGSIGVGFAIPSNTAKRIADEIVKTGKSTHAVLGVSARTATNGDNPEAGTGAQIVQVQANGPASSAGLKSGDVITAVGDRAITSSTELTAAVRSSTPGSKVTLTVQRGGSSQKVDVTLASTN